MLRAKTMVEASAQSEKGVFHPKSATATPVNWEASRISVSAIPLFGTR